ncbi:MAG: lysylphosphatidylglycerol synthase transmembrane domain-containing protein [Rubrobacteraceae bacterium]
MILHIFNLLDRVVLHEKLGGIVRKRSSVPTEMQEKASSPRRGRLEMDEKEPLSLRGRFLNPRTLLSVLLAGAVLFLVFRQFLGLDWHEVWTNVTEANPIFLVVALGVFYTSFYVRALRWKVLLENVGYSRETRVRMPSSWGLARIMYISWFANCVTVVRIGDAYRGYLLKRRAGVSFTVTLGTILAERVLDLAVLAVMLLGSILIVFHGSMPSGVSGPLLAGAIVSALGVATLLILRRFGDSVGRLVPVRFRETYRRLAHGMSGSVARVPALVGYSIAGWAIESATLYLVARSIGADISVWGAISVALVASLLSVFPFTPAGLGVAEAGIILALGWLGVPADIAATIAILDRLITYWSIVFFGFPVYLLGPGRSPETRPGKFIISTESRKEL